MPLENTNPTTTLAWKNLKEHYEKNKSQHLKELFAVDEERASKFTLKWEEFLVDFSKNRITDETFSLLLDLTKEMHLKDAINKYFQGDIINETEGRAVLHTALRAKKTATIMVDGVNVVPEVYEVREKIGNFANGIISGKETGIYGKSI